MRLVFGHYLLLSYGIVNTLSKHQKIGRPRILHLTTGLDVGGTEMMLLRTLPVLEQEFKNYVCAIRGRGSVGRALEDAGIPVYYLDYNNIVDPSALWRFWRVVQSVRPTILTTYLIHADLFGRILGRMYRIPIVVSSQRGSPLQWEFLRTFDRLTTSLVDIYTVQTQVAQRQLSSQLHIPTSRLQIIPNGIDSRQYQAGKCREAVRAAFHLPADAFLITCVSHLRRGKGQSYLLRAFEHIAAGNQNLHLLLIGEGSERETLQQQIKGYHTVSRIHFVGAYQNVSEILSASDVFVMPTLAEGMSNAILEAMASGLSCLISDIAVNLEIIVDGKTGLLFRTADSTDLAEKLVRLVHDQPLRSRLGAAARCYITEQHDIDRTTATLITLYDTLLARQKAVPLPSRGNVSTLPHDPLVSIIISIYNGADTLDACLASIEQQSYSNYEVVCIDDGSTDATVVILQRWQMQLPRLRIISNPRNIGLTKSLNRGIRAASGSLIARIDADDEWMASKLAKQVTFLQDNPSYGMIGCFHINTRGADRYYVRLPIEDFAIRRSIFRMNPFGHSCIVVKKDLIDQVGGYTEQVRYGQDLDLWFRLLPLTKMINIDEFLCTRRTDRGISVSKTRQQMLQSIITTIRYIRLYKAPWVNFMWLTRPLAIILIPPTVKRLIYMLAYPAPAKRS